VRNISLEEDRGMLVLVIVQPREYSGKLPKVKRVYLHRDEAAVVESLLANKLGTVRKGLIDDAR
jgi:hypothetical protein